MDQAGMLRSVVRKSGKPGPDGDNDGKTGDKCVFLIWQKKLVRISLI